jgi:hypothetical protein
LSLLVFSLFGLHIHSDIPLFTQCSSVSDALLFLNDATHDHFLAFFDLYGTLNLLFFNDNGLYGRGFRTLFLGEKLVNAV